MKFLFSTLQIEGDNENDRKKIVTDISQGHEIREPGINPSFHPEGRMDPKEGKVDLNQNRIDIRTEILNQISKGLVDQGDEGNGGEVVQQPSDPSPSFSIRGYLQCPKKAEQQAVKEELGPPERDLSPEEKNQKREANNEEKGQPFSRSNSFHGKSSIP